MSKINTEVLKIHPSFQLNKIQADAFDLVEIAKKFQEQGEPFEQEIGDFLIDWLKPEPHIFVKTSGSTGTPKEISIEKQHMVNSALATGKFFKLPEETTALLCLPVSYIAGKMMLVRAMVLGWHIDCVQPKSNPLDLLYKRYDFCAMTPFQLDNSLARLHLIKKLIVGGGAVSVHLKKLVQGINTKIYETYGMTETVTHIAARKVNSKKNKKKKGPIPFKVLANISVSVDKRNCLVIKAPQISNGTIVTNDVVELLSYKKFILKGRYDNVINSGGIKIHPEQVEKKLQKIILQRFFITSLPDDALGEKVILFIEAAFSEEALAEVKALVENLKTLDKYEQPKKIYFVEKFEETHTGKINRINTLKARLA
ncbi:O-succinylbenzoic acid--CoA ligase [Mesonia maritima]|uniref:O-succinylbenzoic acid--CoA ligase n=2 Tax=Mesonia maritima TaxID=1793873 RepID=A0ABU1K5P4_9FLAO|nr:AMP-binding protein [Mesonia maritima]MDR6300909.1 O-succinylbenzoic acid--CoA ligase [Mesonia maritima]